MPEHRNVNAGFFLSPSNPLTPQFRSWIWKAAVAIAILGLPSALTAQNVADSTMTWPDATAHIIQLKTTSETCISIVKQFGNTNQKAQARLDYGIAKSHADAIISGLEVALFDSGKMSDLHTLQTDLTFVSHEVEQSCGTASGMIHSTPGHKGIAEDIAKAAIEPLLRAVSDGISALYKNHRADRDLTKKTIQAQLEAAKWQEFDRIAAGR